MEEVKVCVEDEADGLLSTRLIAKRGTERRSGSAAHVSVCSVCGCVWVLCVGGCGGPGGGCEEAGGEEARRRGGEEARLVWTHTPLCTSSRNANGFHATLRKKIEVRTRYLRDVGTLYGDRGSAVPACGGVG